MNDLRTLARLAVECVWVVRNHWRTQRHKRMILNDLLADMGCPFPSLALQAIDPANGTTITRLGARQLVWAIRQTVKTGQWPNAWEVGGEAAAGQGNSSGYLMDSPMPNGTDDVLGSSDGEPAEEPTD